MSTSEEGLTENERAKLILEIEQLRAEIRKRVLALAEHPNIPDVFKNHPVVKEITE